MAKGTYEDGYDKGYSDADPEGAYHQGFENGKEYGYTQGRSDALHESREPAFRKALQAFHLMYHKGSFTFEKCWDEPCKSVRQ